MNIVFDIGGTNTRMAMSEDGDTISKPITYQTPQNYKEGIKTFIETARKLAKEKPIQAIAGGIPGPLNKEKTMVVNAPNLPDYNNKPFKEDIEKQLSTLLYIENDTAMIGLGEALKGAGKGKRIVAYITFSTGVGGCRIVDGKIAPSALGFEPGHQIISSAPNSTQETLDHFTSGIHIEKKYEKSARNITDKDIWEDITYYMAVGLNNVIVLWSPDIVVIGGAIIKSGKTPIDHIRNHLKKITKIFPEIPPVELSELGETAGLIGSLEYLSDLNLM